MPPSWARVMCFPGSQVEDTTIALLGEQRPAAAAAAEGVMEEEHAGALVPAHALEEEQEEPEDVWPWVPRELDDAFWGACRNAVSTLGLLVRDASRSLCHLAEGERELREGRIVCHTPNPIHTTLSVRAYAHVEMGKTVSPIARKVRRF